MTLYFDKFFDFKYFSGGDAEHRPESLRVLPAYGSVTSPSIEFLEGVE